MIFSLLKNYGFDEDKGWVWRKTLLDKNKEFSTNALLNVSYGNGNFLIVGGGVSATSTTGLNYTINRSVSGTSIGNTSPTDINFFNGYFWAVSGIKIYKSANGHGWEEVYSSSTSGITTFSMYKITYCFGKYIVMGDGYTVTSTDGINWVAAQTLKATTWGTTRVNTYVVFNNTLWIAGASGRIAKTTNGTTWTYVTAITGTPTIYHIDLYGTSLVAYCSLGKIFKSTNGSTWTASTILSANTNWKTVDIRNFARNGTRLVAMSYNSAKHAVSTNGGTSWTVYTNNSLYTAFGGAFAINKITFGGGYFVAVGDGGKIARSADGITWTKCSDINGDETAQWKPTDAVNSIAWDGTNYMIVGDNSRYATSTNLKTWNHNLNLVTGGWTTSSTGVSAVWTVATHNGGFIIAGASPALYKSLGNNSLIGYTSKTNNYNNWEYNNSLAASSGGSFPILKVKELNNILFYIGSKIAYTSVFPNTPTKCSFGGNDMIYANGKYMVAGTDGSIYTSSDLLTWTTITSVKTSSYGANHIYGLAWGNNKYVAVGPTGKMATSSNGTVWTYLAAGTANNYWGTEDINTIIFADGYFWIGGNNSKVMKSIDGVTWTSVPEVATTWKNTYKITEIQFLNNMLIFLGTNGAIVTFKK